MRTPGGKVIDTFIEELEMISFRTRPKKIPAPILLPKDLKKDDVPIGTEVWLLEETYEVIKSPST